MKLIKHVCYEIVFTSVPLLLSYKKHFAFFKFLKLQTLSIRSHMLAHITTSVAELIGSDVLMVSRVKLSLVQLVKWINWPTKLLKISLSLREDWSFMGRLVQTEEQQTWTRQLYAYVFSLCLTVHIQVFFCRSRCVKVVWVKLYSVHQEWLREFIHCETPLLTNRVMSWSCLGQNIDILYWSKLVNGSFKNKVCQTEGEHYGPKLSLHYFEDITMSDKCVYPGQSKVWGKRCGWIYVFCKWWHKSSHLPLKPRNVCVCVCACRWIKSS